MYRRCHCFKDKSYLSTRVDAALSGGAQIGLRFQLPIKATAADAEGSRRAIGRITLHLFDPLVSSYGPLQTTLRVFFEHLALLGRITDLTLWLVNQFWSASTSPGKGLPFSLYGLYLLRLAFDGFIVFLGLKI